MDVIWLWNLTLELLERAYRFQEFTRVCLQNRSYNDPWPQFTTQDEWTIVKDIMEVVRTFWYWTLWMSKRHTITPHHTLPIPNIMFNYMDGVMLALAKKKIEWKQDLYSAVKCVREIISQYDAEVTPTTGMVLVFARILNPFQMLPLFMRWGKGMDTNPEDQTPYATQSQEAFLRYAVNEYCAKHQVISVITPEHVPGSNLFPSVIASWSGQFCSDAYDLSSHDDKYLTPKSVAEMTPGWSDRAACSLTAATVYMHSPPGAPKNQGQVNTNHNHHHSNPMEICNMFWLPDISDWSHQQEERHSTYADLSNVARDTFLFIPHCVWVEARCSLRRDIIGWWKSKTTGKTLWE